MTKFSSPPEALKLSEQLANFATRLSLEQVPASVRSRATWLIVDAVGIALASTWRDFARVTLAGLRELAGSIGDIPVIGMGQSLPMRDAVMMNAVLVHGLDYDDTHPAGIIHASASVLPSVLCLAARLSASGAEMLAAYLVGMETASRLAAAAKGGFHQVGFHPTSLIGTFGSTLAASRLLRLPLQGAIDAQGIAVSFASGNLEFLQDGAWTKRIHPGWAGAAGITAATLAKNGFVGTSAPYEGRFGLYRSYLGSLAEQCDLGLVTAGLGRSWETSRVAIKPMPACHLTHACADAASLLHANWHGAPVRRIVARVPAAAMELVCEPIKNKRRPANAYEAQFSIPYSVATGLRFGRFTLDALEPAAYSDPQTLALAALVECEADLTADFPRYFGGEVIVELQDGCILRHAEPVNRGAEGRPISEDDISIKFYDNAARTVSRGHADHILNAVLGIEHGSAAELAQLLGVAGRGNG